MNGYRIVNETGFGSPTKVYAPDGTDVSNSIRSIDVRLRCNELVSAEFEVAVSSVEVSPGVVRWFGLDEVPTSVLADELSARDSVEVPA